MSAGIVPEDAGLTRRAHVSRNNGTPAGVCLVLSQRELRNFGINPDDCESVYYYLENTQVDGSKVSVLRIVASDDIEDSIAD